MNELQKAQNEMLKVVIKICDELDLKYYLVCGSALGAAKYGGFIPWDDDLDIGLMRKDYEIFINEACAKLPEPLFLQNYHTENSCTNIFSKLRNSKTTFIERSVSHLDINHGVYIDIFPLDGYPQNKKNAEILEKKKKLYNLHLACAYRAGGFSKAQILFAIERAFGLHKHIKTTIRNFEKMIVKYSIENSQLICNHGNWQGKLEYAPKEQYGDGIMMKFEGIDVRIPEKYDEYLTQKYGDWRADLPEEEKVGHHYAEVIDLTRPYTDYVEHLPNGKIRIKKKDEIN